MMLITSVVFFHRNISRLHENLSTRHRFKNSTHPILNLRAEAGCQVKENTQILKRETDIYKVTLDDKSYMEIAAQNRNNSFTEVSYNGWLLPCQKIQAQIAVGILD